MYIPTVNEYLTTHQKICGKLENVKENKCESYIEGLTEKSYEHHKECYETMRSRLIDQTKYHTRRELEDV